MERKRVIYLVLFFVLILVLSSCHPRHPSDIKPAMTKEKVISLWGPTNLISHKNVEGLGDLEIWEYHFSSSDSICSVTFSQERVSTTQCRPVRGGTYYSYSPSGQNKAGPRAREQSLVREGYFAMELTEVLNMGEVRSEAEAESRLASVGISPKNGWIADYPLTPGIIGELRTAVGEASDSGKIAMSREEAIRAFDDLITSIESQTAEVEPFPGRDPYPEPYDYPRFYYFPYSFPPPYTFGGYYRFHFPPRRHWR